MNLKQLIKAFLTLILLFSVVSCATSPPKNLDNICSIFKEKRRWYKHAKRSAKQWKSEIPIMMAFMHQESRFKRKAKPPRKKILWVIPGPRLSDAYGYAQAKKDTWRWYRRSSGNGSADRDDFKDAVDFVAWYNFQSAKRNKIRSDDAYNLYLAYHEGHGGYSRGTYRKKSWLKGVASKVDQRAKRYQQQLQSCEKSLNKKRWLFF